MRSRVVLAGAGLWLAVVAVTSGVTWLVIQRVGDVVTASEAPAPVGPTSAAPSASAPASTVPPSATPSRHPRPHPHTKPPRSTLLRPAMPSGSPSVRVSLPPVVRPSAPPPVVRGNTSSPRPSDGGGGTGGGPGRGSATPTSPRTPSTQTTTRTWSGASGRVTVTCAGARSSLQSASPANGWRVEVGSRGGEEVEVTFQQSGGGGLAEVKARCAGGAPTFRVESSRESDD